MVQGGALRTWSYPQEQMQFVLSTNGGPLDANIELWHGPDSTPCMIHVYAVNGKQHPFNAVIETPMGPNTVTIRNIGHIVDPIAANVVGDSGKVDGPSEQCTSSYTTIEGGALDTYHCDPSVNSIQVLLNTDG